MTVTLSSERGYIGLGKQSVQGTGVAATVFFKPVGAPKRKRMQAINYYRDGNVRDFTFRMKQSYAVSYKFRTFYYPEVAAALYAWAMGADTVTGGSDPYTHTITLAENLPYLSLGLGIYQNTSGTNSMLRRVVDVKIDKLKILFAKAAPVYLDVELIGCTEAIPSADSPAYTDTPATEGPGMFHQTAFTLSGPTNATSFDDQWSGLEVELDNGLVPEFGPNQLTPIAIFEGQRNIRGRFDAIYYDAYIDLLTYFGGNSGTTPSPTVGSGTIVATTTVVTGTEHSMALTLGALDFLDADADIDPKSELARISVPFQCTRSGSTYPIAMVVKSSVSTDFA